MAALTIFFFQGRQEHTQDFITASPDSLHVNTYQLWCVNRSPKHPVTICLNSTAPL